jgi:uncharacterized surface protein with fasciclin (FAS1) repeats
MRMAVVRMFILLLAPGSWACGAAHKPTKISDLDDTVNKTVILSKFAALVHASNLGTFLSSRGPFTLFAPTNSAFSKLPPGTFEDLLRPENQVQLQRIVLFQLVSGRAWDFKDLATTKTLLSCEGNPLTLTVRRGAQRVGKAQIIRADIHCANGLMDQVDTLMMPPHLLLVAAVANADAAQATNTAPANPAAETNAVPVPATNSAPAPQTTATNAPDNATTPPPEQTPSMR